MTTAVPFTVNCPSCDTSFPVDPRKVPRGGVYAICSACERVFHVPAERDAQAGAAGTDARAGSEVASPAASGAPNGGAMPGAPGGGRRAGDDEAGRGGNGGAAPGDTGAGAPAAAGSMEGAEADSEREWSNLQDLTFEPDEGDEGVEVVEAEAADGAVEVVEPDADGAGATGAAGMPASSVGPGEPDAAAASTGGSAEVEDQGDGAGGPTAAPTFGRRDPHERAARLARVLASDIIAYNQEKYRRALEEGTLASELEEEIERSWEEYVEQVGKEMAEEHTYFQDALNEILARGERTF